MNCHKFNDELYDYLDGTLSFERTNEVREHLMNCVQCRRALEQEQTTARFLNESLHQATAGLSLNPLPALIVHRACEQPQSNFFKLAWCWLTAGPRRPLGIGAALFIIIAAVFVVRRGGMNSASTRAGQAEAAVVDVPIVFTSHVFQRQHDSVVDAMGSTIAMAHAGFSRSNNH